MFARNFQLFSILKAKPSVFVRHQHAELLMRPEWSQWKSVIGLEIHAQLDVDSKLFSPSENVYAAPVNSRVSLFDAAIPGTLPVLNKKCVELAVLSSLALKCRINPVSYFDRKHYFYSDLPAGYQITQQRIPIAINGLVNYTVHNPRYLINKIYRKVSKIKQVQLEQDSGKSFHNEAERISFIDLNRANVGLIEIVFDPDLSTADEAAALVKEITVIMQRAGTCTCKMGEGALRVDANVSVHKAGTPLGTRTEVKNLSSIRSITDAINYEINRQLKTIGDGGVVTNETVGWDAVEKRTFLMREKEERHDYRFMPEPNLPPLRIIVDDNSKDFHKNVTSSGSVFDLKYLQEKIPRLPYEDRESLIAEYKILDEMAYNLVNDEPQRKLFVQVMNGNPNLNGQIVFKVMKYGLGLALKANKLDLEDCTLDPVAVGKICYHLQSNNITMTTSTALFLELLNGSTSTVDDIIKDKNLLAITDTAQLEKICNEVLDAWPRNVKRYLKGRTDYLERLVRRAVAAADNRVKSQTIEKMLKRLIEEREKKSSEPK